MLDHLHKDLPKEPPKTEELNEKANEKYIGKIKDIKETINTIIIFLSLMFGFYLTIIYDLYVNKPYLFWYMYVGLISLITINCIYCCFGLIYGIMINCIVSDISDDKDKKIFWTKVPDQKRLYDLFKDKFKNMKNIFIFSAGFTAILMGAMLFLIFFPRLSA